MPRLVSGSGEDLGFVIGVERDERGAPKWLLFQEHEGAPLRKVRLEYVRHADAARVRLAGPREGYHITRVTRDVTAGASPRGASPGATFPP